MPASSIFYFRLILLFCLIKNFNGEKKCNGGNIEQLEDDCTTIGKLIIEGDVSEETLKSKLKSVEKITEGLQINKTSIKHFNYLRRVKSIQNEKGYGIILFENRHLVRFQLPQNVALNGTPKAVYFEKDGFLKTAVMIQGEALGDFAMLEIASKSDDWYDIADLPAPGTDVLAIMLIFPCVGMIVLLYLTCRYFDKGMSYFSNKSKSNHGPGAAEEGRKQRKKFFTSASTAANQDNSKMQSASKIQPTNTSKSLTKSGDSKSLQNPMETSKLPKPLKPSKASKPEKSPKAKKGKKTKQ